MNKAIFALTALAFAFIITPNDDASAYTYKAGKEYNGNVRYTRYGTRDAYKYTFYKKSRRRGHYASSASLQRNPYQQNITEADLQKMEELAYSRYNSRKAPTGNYSRRAFMPNK
jgi:hypothetical protein